MILSKKATMSQMSYFCSLLLILPIVDLYLAILRIALVLNETRTVKTALETGSCILAVATAWILRREGKVLPPARNWTVLPWSTSP
jgi:hypothetical protein